MIPSECADLEAACRLDQAIDGLTDGKDSDFLDQEFEVTPFHILHDQEVDAIDFLDAFKTTNNVRMLDLGKCQGFAPKSFHDRPAPTGKRRRQDLQGDDHPVITVEGLENHSHATAADLVEHDVRADQEPLALALINGRRLVGGKHTRPHELVGDPRHVGGTAFGRQTTDELTEKASVHQPRLVEKSTERLDVSVMMRRRSVRRGCLVHFHRAAISAGIPHGTLRFAVRTSLLCGHRPDPDREWKRNID